MGILAYTFHPKLTDARPMSSALLYIAKVALSATVIVAVSEVAKRSTSFAALIASLPLTSLLAFIWLHIDGTEPQKIAELSVQVLWLVIPSLAFFIILPLLLHRGTGFWISLAVAALVTAGCYLAMLPVIRRLGGSL